jgi:hypothetical protein
VSDGSDLEALTRALGDLSGTNTEEQIFIVPSVATQSWHLDVVELDDDGPRFAVYAEFDTAVPFSQRGLSLPTGSVVEADEGSNVTITFGELTESEAAKLLSQWGQLLSGDTGFGWSSSQD